MKRIDSTPIFAILFLAVVLSLLCFSPARAAGQNKSEQTPTLTEKFAKSDSPIKITADRMEARQEERSILFDGHVTVQQDDLVLTGHKLKVVALAGDKSNSSAPTDKIDYIEAEGDVKVTQKDRLATADKAVFYQKDQKIVLYGHPTVTKGQDKIEGTLITIYLQQGRSVVEGGKGTPVQAVLFPGKKEF